MSACTTISFSFMNLALLEEDSLGAKFFYGLWVCSFYASFPGIFASMAPACMQHFGPDHYFANYGLLFTNNVRSLRCTMHIAASVKFAVECKITYGEG